MLVSYRWLRDYVEVDVPADQLADRLTMAGLKVESVTRRGEGLRDVVIGRLVSVERHPGADHLFVCQVDIGDRNLQVVTGATNVQAGDRVPVAPPGSALPGGVEIRTVDMRGVRSEGMLCSEDELGVGDDRSGIWILPAGSPVGASLAEALELEDDLIEIEVYPNRPDCLGMIGIAREVAAILGKPLRLPEFTVPEGSVAAESFASVEILDTALCGRYTARVLRGVRVGPSPWWMQLRLRAAGMRPINNIVDVTNFVMLEMGHPLHAFDLDRLEGHRVLVRRARRGEHLVTLDRQNRELDEETLVIADAAKPAAIAGVMGGWESEVRPETVDLLLESATFHPASIRKTSRRLGLRSEASMRFEKGLPPEQTVPALERASALILELAGGTAARGRLDQYPHPRLARQVALRVSRVSEVLGVDVPAGEVEDILRRLDFAVEKRASGQLQVGVPYFRQDVEREMDLVEEVGRLYGFDRVPPTLPRGGQRGGVQRDELLLGALRDALVATGLREIVSYSFISPRAWDRLRLPEDHPARWCIALRNPISEEQSVMRTTLLPSLLEALARNAHRQRADVALFEIGSVYLPQQLPMTELPAEEKRCGIALMGNPGGRRWYAPARAADFYDAKGAVEAALEVFGADARFEPAEHPALHPGRTARVVVGDREVGIVGELHPLVQAAYELPYRVAVAELALEPLMLRAEIRPTYRPLPRYPAIVRDLALIAPVEVPAAEIEGVIRQEGGALVREIVLFDVYQGEQIPAGRRSLGYSVTYRAADRTLTDEEVAEVERRIADRLERQWGIGVRSS